MVDRPGSKCHQTYECTYSLQTFFGIPCGTIEKNLNFSYANMKWFVSLWENTKDPSISQCENNYSKTLKYWSHNSLGEFLSVFCEFNFNLAEVSTLFPAGNAKKKGSL